MPTNKETTCMAKLQPWGRLKETFSWSANQKGRGHKHRNQEGAYPFQPEDNALAFDLFGLDALLLPGGGERIVNF